jgi:hypothetical protein
MSKEVKRYDPFGYDGLSALMHEDAYGEWVRSENYDALRLELAEANADFVRIANERDALLAERNRMKAENKRLDLMVAQVDHNYDMDRDRMMYLLRTAHDCLEQWNLKYPGLAKRGEEFSSEHTYRQIRAFVPEYREADAALQGEQPCT